MKLFQGVLCLLATLSVAGCDKVEDAIQKDMQEDIAKDLIEQYEIAKRQGNKMDTCTHAGAVAMTYLSAKDEANYAKWTATQNAECTAAGLPMGD